jgi:dienelactone hydrolase
VTAHARLGVPLALVLALLAPVLQPAQAHAASATTFAATVSAIEALTYQPAYVASGTDSAFAANATPVVNTPPADDYTGGSIPGSDPTGASNAPPWPPSFVSQTIISSDGAKLQGMVALHPGFHPGIVVVHGFNTNAKESVIRWAAMLAANGYDVAAFDQRDFAAEYNADATHSSLKTPQSFGFKEAEDVLTAGAWLKGQTGVTSVGVVGFSEGAQNTVLAVSRDTAHVFDAAITFSAPADQDSQIYSTAVPSNCQTPNCTYPVTDALINVVVPPDTYNDPCKVLADAATAYHTTSYQILAGESAMHAQTAATIPLLNFFAADDSLVLPFNAAFMAAYEQGNPLQRTIEISKGEHAYYFDRWWQQSAILTYFHDLLPGDATITANPTVNQTPGGAAVSTQEVAISPLTPAAADAQLAPYVCDTTQPPPGLQPGSNLATGAPLPLAAAGVIAVLYGAMRSRRRLSGR